MPRMPASSERGTKSTITFWITTYVLEKRSRSPQIVASTGDRPHLEIPIDFSLNSLKLLVLFKNVQIVSKVGYFHLNSLSKGYTRELPMDCHSGRQNCLSFNDSIADPL